MKIIKPYYQIMSPISKDMLINIERAGRTCYKSEDKITDDSADKFVRMIINRGHESVLEHEKITVLFVCDRGISHELVRHRIASFSQESTRYCNYTKDKFNGEITLIEPPIKCNNNTYARQVWIEHMEQAEINYKLFIDLGIPPEIARSVLPASLKTEIAVTANLREWRTILKQRTAKSAHPQMRELMCPLLDELKQLLPVIFDDINYETHN